MVRLPPPSAALLFSLLPLAAVVAFLEFFDHLGVEGGDVVGVAAGDNALVHDDLLVDPFGAAEGEFVFQAGPAGHFQAFADAGFAEAPGAVADGGDGCAVVVERTDELHGVRVQAELVGVDGAAGQEEAVVVAGVGLRDGVVHVVFVLGFEVAFHALDLPGLEADEVRGGPGGFQGLAGFDEFDLFDAVGGEDGDGFAFQGLVGHAFSVPCGGVRGVMVV